MMDKKWEMVPNNAVRVTDRYYDEAMHLDIKNMLLLDYDRLLAGFRETAGLIAGMDSLQIKAFMKSKERYGGMWEDGLIGGHTLGHVLTALSQAMGNPALNENERIEVEKKLDYILEALRQCQEYTRDTSYEGYIFGAVMPTKEFRDNPALQFDNVEKGLCELFTQSWVPWYTMHKIMTGLCAGFRIAKKDLALKIANDLGIWIANRTEGWTEDVRKTVIGIEYGGMNDCLYELYQINRKLAHKGDKRAYPSYERFEAAAHSFDEEVLFEKILSGKENALNNVHANTTIPKFIGALARYETDNSQERYLEYAKSFWDLVVTKHTYVTGGNSENEHFGEDNVLDLERTHVNNETCNTYNMLKFSRRLFAATGDKKYLDYFERTLINAIMASQNHDTGFTTYFQPMATGYFKVFNTLEGNFWCCTGTGYENFTKLNEGIYYKGNGCIAVGVCLSSVYQGDDYSIEQSCDFTNSDIARIKITPDSGKVVNDDLLLRIPSWVRNRAEITINGHEYEAQEHDGFWMIPSEKISDGAEITLKLPMGITCENLPDGKDTYAFCYGPYVLSARLGNAKMRTTTHGVAVSVPVPGEKNVDSDTLKITSEKSVSDFITNIDKYLVRKGDLMEFELLGTSRNLTFTTHYNQYTESYGIYWKFCM